MFILTQDLLERNQNFCTVTPADTPRDWDYSQQCTPECVDVWEVVQYIPDAVWIVAAADPWIEYYAVVPTNPMLPWETFYSSQASERCAARALELGIQLENTTSWSTLIASTAEL